MTSSQANGERNDWQKSFFNWMKVFLTESDNRLGICNIFFYVSFSWKISFLLEKKWMKIVERNNTEMDKNDKFF